MLDCQLHSQIWTEIRREGSHGVERVYGGGSELTGKKERDGGDDERRDEGSDVGCVLS